MFLVIFPNLNYAFENQFFHQQITGKFFFATISFVKGRKAEVPHSEHHDLEFQIQLDRLHQQSKTSGSQTFPMRGPFKIFLLLREADNIDLNRV
jgi:hypothetical protein